MTITQINQGLKIVEKMKQEGSPCPEYFCDNFWQTLCHNLEIYLLLK